jgi:hypothetical protein
MATSTDPSKGSMQRRYPAGPVGGCGAGLSYGPGGNDLFGNNCPKSAKLFLAANFTQESLALVFVLAWPDRFFLDIEQFVFDSVVSIANDSYLS